MWSHIAPSSSVWPQPRYHHAVCTLLCDNQEIKVLLLGGYGERGILNDCWLLDVIRGIGEKVRKKKEGKMYAVRMDDFPLICCHRSNLTERHLVVMLILLVV